jgi:phosphate acyltransferase
MRIAVDAMGGDHAPQAIVEGAILAAREYPKIEVILVGDKFRISALLNHVEKLPKSISIQHASEVIEMGESPLLGLRKKKDSSIAVAVQLVKEGRADAVVSAGNTGAVVTATKLKLRFLEGIERPAIGTVFRHNKGVSLLLDAGANIDCIPRHLFEFAIMGSDYAKEILGYPKPRVGLLSIGEEASKGNELTKEVFSMLEKTNLNFIGNVEGRDLLTGAADVIICDGFVGNVVLKVGESVAVYFKELMKKEFTSNPIRKLGALLLTGAFRSIARKADYAEYGGAPLIGVRGTCIICHGRSNPKAIKNAIRVASEVVSHHVNQHIVESIKANGHALARPPKSVS